MKRIFTRALLACLLAALSCAGAALAEVPDKLTVTLENKTDAKIYFALSAVSGGGINDYDYSWGWWVVQPGKKRTLKFDYSPAYHYGFYAMSPDARRVWAGRNKEDKSLGEFWIQTNDFKKAFKTHPDKPIKGGKQVFFRSLHESDMGKAAITFTVKKKK